MAEPDESTDTSDSLHEGVYQKLANAARWAADVFKGHAGADNLKKRNR